MKKLAAVFVIATLLLNTMAPTLAYAATYLQGAQVNADTLIQDAYAVVTYYDSKNKQKSEKGWINDARHARYTTRNFSASTHNFVPPNSCPRGYPTRTYNIFLSTYYFNLSS